MKQFLYLIRVDSMKTRFLQDCDVFEKSKVIILPTVKLTFDLKATVAEKVNEAKEKCSVTMINSNSKEDKIICIFDDKNIFYIDNEVNVVSDGSCFCLLSEYLKQF